jgi:hypothetical protein
VFRISAENQKGVKLGENQAYNWAFSSIPPATSIATGTPSAAALPHVQQTLLLPIHSSH